jgi:hypothetical protein
VTGATAPAEAGPQPPEPPLTLTEARDIVEGFRRLVREQPDPDLDELRLFPRQTPDRRSLIRKAWAVLLRQGDEIEQRYAAWILGYEGTAEDVALLALLYAERGWDSSHISAPGLVRQHAKLTFEQRRALSRVFVADPRRHLTVASALFRDEDDAAAWECLAAMVGAVDDPRILAEACEATMGTARQADFSMLLRRRPEHVVRAVAGCLNAGTAERLLMEWGVGPEESRGTK